MSIRYKGGIISATPPVTTTSSASGAWTLEQQMQAQGAGTWPQPPSQFIEDWFSTYLYTGNGSAQTINNGIDLSANGGLVWFKTRARASGDLYSGHFLYDSARGLSTTSYVMTNNTEAQGWVGALAPAPTFLSNGFTTPGPANNNTETEVAWTFAKRAKFFDIVTWTGNATNRTIAHNLGAVPGCIIVKRTDATQAWAVYHSSLANTEYLVLNTTAAKATGATWWNSTTPTSSVFSVGTDASVNASGGTYVAYLFANNAGGFGVSGSENVITCGTFTTDGSGNTSINLGYEPQFFMHKKTSATSQWYINDNMRGMFAPGSSWQNLYFNTASAEAAQGIGATNGLNSTGLTFGTDASSTYIYVAIRRGPMKTPTVGTSVFSPLARTGTGANTTITAGFPIDMMVYINSNRAWDVRNFFSDRLRDVPTAALTSTNTQVETSVAAAFQGIGVDSNTGVNVTADTANAVINRSGVPYVNYFFGRAPGFFDVVCYTGTGSATTFSHNLGVVPELMIVKSRNAAGNNWTVYSQSIVSGNVLFLNGTAGSSAGTTSYNSTAPTASVFTVGTNSATNGSGALLVNYLFATCPGVSKVGSYTGTAALQTIACGFTTGARYVLIKRTDTTGDWYSYNSSSGITSGNDPYMLLNSTAAEVTGTNYVDTDTTGFKVTAAAPAGLNAVGGTYIFLAIA